jgi:alkylhydroperoxidase family enzyme
MASRIEPVKVGGSADEEVNALLRDAREGWWRDPAMFGVLGRRPALLKTIVPAIGAFFGGGRVEPYLFELMRIKGARTRECTYCSTIRVAGVADQVRPLEAALIGSGAGALSPREAVAVELAERMARDAHSVDDAFWLRLKEHFDDDELVELVFGAAIFGWGSTFNITMRLDATAEGPYGTGMRYDTTGVAATRREERA